MMPRAMIQETISTESARRFYNWLGAGHDRAEFYESKAKNLALQRLELAAGQHVLNVGVGTGKIHQQLKAAIAPNGLAFGLDISTVMLRLSQARTGCPLCQANARRLPFATHSFDRLISTFVLDLLPLRHLPGLLVNFKRVLKPGGRMVLVSLTEGVTASSRLLVGLWKITYAISPIACGGCRPLQLEALVQRAGFSAIQREVVVQAGIPSEVITATC